MKRVLALALSAGLLAGSAFAASPWDGTYLFEQPIGPGSGGLQLFVNHKLTIGPNGCTIVAQGYQTNEQIRCKATPSGNKLDVAFVSYADGKLVNVHGVKIYEPLAQLALCTCGGRALFRSLPLERLARCGAVMLPWTAEVCLERIGRESLYAPGEEDGQEAR